MSKTQRYAEEVLDQNMCLTSAIEEMEKDRIIKNDVFVALKILMCLTLLFYLSGGAQAESLLAGAVSFYLVAEGVFHFL